ncbi:ATPase [Halobacteriales archaeon QS_4_62_28]|nr:MAG: ATPase [Halobacteriales archaeon QS_4_62_28]
MSFVLGRADDASAGNTGRLGCYRALDGSEGAPLYLDLDGPHAALIVGKRGYGKSYTLGVVAEELARARGVAPVIIDPMGVFTAMGELADGEPVPATIVDDPAVPPASLDPQSWCALLGLAPESGAGGLVWQAASDATTIEEMREAVQATDAPDADRRAASNHVAMADGWRVFDADGLSAADLSGGEVTVVDLSGLDAAPMNAVASGICESLYRARIEETIERLPWILLDEAHTFFDGVAASALETILTRGRAPGVSLVLATQRPSVVPAVGRSQSDLLVSHRLTTQRDLDALDAARPTYMDESLAERLPAVPGEVVVVDDATETVHAAQVRERATPHGGESPSASAVSLDG